MKQDNNINSVTVSRKGEASIKEGSLWVYDSEVFCDNDAIENGEAVRVHNQRGRYVATAFINRNSKIRLRVLSRNANEPVDAAFFERRLRRAVEYRRTVMGEQFGCCRLVFGEADALPGLTVDRFGDVLVAQTVCLGTERMKQTIFSILVDILRESGETISGIYERNDLTVRELEGMEQSKGWFPLSGCVGGPTDIIITENGIKYHVDIENGQKTGFFLDQKFNRQAAAALAKGRRVLDCFTHTGSFALNAAAAGAERVTAVDISPQAVELARQNAILNHLEDRMDFVCANVFDMLPEMRQGEYDFIILDPPAFTKSRSTIESALKGYKEINLRAMKLLDRGGYLATCSCSHFVSDSMFRDMLRSAADDVGASLRQIEARQQAKDHPILWNSPETSYLKFYLFQKV